MEKETGWSAFPIVNAMGTECYGMTLRDYFAAKAISGACANSLPDKLYCEVAAKRAYELADAMLEARK